MRRTIVVAGLVVALLLGFAFRGGIVQAEEPRLDAGGAEAVDEGVANPGEEVVIVEEIQTNPEVRYCSASGWLALYEHTHHNRYQNGRCLRFQYGGVQNLGNYSFNDKLSSVKNDTPYRVYFYWDSGGRGRRTSIAPHTHWTSMPKISGHDWNDDVSSFCIKRPNTSCP